MAASGGTRAVVAALLANLGIAVAKFIAWALTASSSMLAEAIHSVADSGNQALLLLGGRRARREATPEHPFGFGRSRYIYAFIVSIVLFSVGGLFALYEAYHKWDETREGHPNELLEGGLWWVPVLVLLFAIVLETFSFRTAIHESNLVRGRASWRQFVTRAKAPELPVVLLEDLGALIGLFFALIGVSMTVITDNGYWDAAGTAAIGILLVIIAIVLARETSSLLLGEAGTTEHIHKIEAALVDDARVERLIHMRTMHLGPDELLVAAKIGVADRATAEEVADTINAAERRVRAAVPIATNVYLEPDIYRADYTPEPRPEVPHAPSGH